MYFRFKPVLIADDVPNVLEVRANLADHAHGVRAGSLVSVPALISAPLVFLALLAAKMFSKMIPLVPTVPAFNYLGHEGMYYSLMMSTGLTFGTISGLFHCPKKVIFWDTVLTPADFFGGSPKRTA